MRVRIAIPTNGNSLDDPIAERFGRAPRFVIIDVDDNGNILSYELHDNPGYRAGSGAGVKAAQKLGDLRVNVYIGPTPGPNAYSALKYLGIDVIEAYGTTVKEAVNRYLRNKKHTT